MSLENVEGQHQPRLQLAIEMSGRQSEVCLACRDDLQIAHLPQVRRHNVDLMPTVARIIESSGYAPVDLSCIYVSLGPGSFTGLRIAVATAKMLALTLNVKVIGVPTLDVLLHNVPADFNMAAVGLNYKRDTIYGGVFERIDSDQTWVEHLPRDLHHVEDWLAQTPRPAAVLAQQVELPPGIAQGLTLLPESTAQGRSRAVLKIGQQLALRDSFANPAELSPLYIREPEAVTLWRERH